MGHSKTFHSDHPEEATQYFCETLAPHTARYNIEKPFSASAHTANLGDVTLIEMSYGADAEIHPELNEEFFLVHATLQGHGYIRNEQGDVKLTPQRIHVSSPGEKLSFYKIADSRYLTVRLPQPLMEDYLRNILERRVHQPLQFTSQPGENEPFAQAWCEHIVHLLRQTSLLKSERMAAHYLQIMAEMLLFNQPNNYSAELHQDTVEPPPSHVQRALEKIDTSLADKISLTELAREIGVSVRCLQNGFNKFLGVTPVEYIRTQRLRRLHDALQNPPDGETVTTLMLDCGIGNFGRYAGYYKEQYGCSPSDTLQKAQRYN